MKKMKRTIPNFKNEDEEREFWATHSLWIILIRRSSKRVISKPEALAQIHLYSPPRDLLIELKTLANKKDVLIKVLQKCFSQNKLSSNGNPW